MSASQAIHRVPPTANFSALEGLRGRSIVSTFDLDTQEIIELCQLAAALEATGLHAGQPLDGAIVIATFFEPSTRTRLSFESVTHRLGGRVLSVADGKNTSSSKGETLADFGEMLNAYGDLVVMRHPNPESMQEVMLGLRLPLINAGNGQFEHPTQALVDWYALLKWRPALAMPDCDASARVHLTVVGDPLRLRASRSFLRMAGTLSHAVSGVTIASSSALSLDELRDDLFEGRPLPFEIDVTADLDEALAAADVVYVNSVAWTAAGCRAIDAELMIDDTAPLQPHAVVLHPLPRVRDISRSLDDTPHNLYFAQAAGACFIRSALLISLLGSLERLDHLPTGQLQR